MISGSGLFLLNLQMRLFAFVLILLDQWVNLFQFQFRGCIGISYSYILGLNKSIL